MPKAKESHHCRYHHNVLVNPLTQIFLDIKWSLVTTIYKVVLVFFILPFATSMSIFIWTRTYFKGKIYVFQSLFDLLTNFISFKEAQWFEDCYTRGICEDCNKMENCSFTDEKLTTKICLSPTFNVSTD